MKAISDGDQVSVTRVSHGWVTPGQPVKLEPVAPRIPRAVFIRLPLRIQSEMNLREHWRKHAKRKAEHRNVARMAVLAQRAAFAGITPPLVVTLTRIGPQKLDSDNVQGGFKHVRDGVSLALGIDDGDDVRLAWRYLQRKGIKREYACEILIERALVTSRPL